MPEEFVYKVPLGKSSKASKNKRAGRSIKLVKEFLKRHAKTDAVVIDQELNQKLWSRGAENPPSHIQVRAVKRDDGVVEAFYAGG